MTNVGTCVVLGLWLTACGVGDDGHHSTVTTPNDALGVICDDPLTTTGTYTRGKTCSDTGTSCGGASDPACNGGATCVAALPTNIPADACFPIGTWTFTAKLTGAEACPSPVQLLPSYTVEVTETVDGSGDPLETATYTTDPTTHSQTKVSGGGGALCEGVFLLYSADGTQVWNFNPTLSTDNMTIGGQGLYRVYSSDQWGDGT